MVCTFVIYVIDLLSMDDLNHLAPQVLSALGPFIDQALMKIILTHALVTFSHSQVIPRSFPCHTLVIVKSNAE